MGNSGYFTLMIGVVGPHLYLVGAHLVGKWWPILSVTAVRTPLLALDWNTWTELMANHGLAPKGMSTTERAEHMADHAMKWKLRHGLGGDVSAWDTSWPHCAKVLPAVLDEVFSGPELSPLWWRQRQLGPKRTTPHLGVVHMAAGLSTSALGHLFILVIEIDPG